MRDSGAPHKRPFEYKADAEGRFVTQLAIDQASPQTARRFPTLGQLPYTERP